MPGEDFRLQCLLEHEIRCARRYRRFIAVVCVAPSLQWSSLDVALYGVRRECDTIIETERETILLMPETDCVTALTALHRYRHRYHGNLEMRYGVAVFPSDGLSAERLLAVAHRRMNEAATATANRSGADSPRPSREK